MISAQLLSLALAASPLSIDADRYALILIGEVDYRNQSAQVEGLNGFALARFRVGGRAQPVSWLKLVGTVEWAGEKPALTDAYVELTPFDSLRILIGYSKTPLFVSAKDQQIEALAIPEKSMLVRAFWPRRDLGVELTWRPRRVPIETFLRVGNGSGNPIGNDNDHPAADARVDLALGRERRGVGPNRAWGLRLGVGVHGENAFDRAGIAGTTSQGFLFYRAATVTGERAVAEAHLSVSVFQARLLIEAAQAWESRSRDIDGNPMTPREVLPTVQSRGLSAELSYVIRGLPRVSPSWPAEGTDDWSGGAVELAARFERLRLGLDAPDLKAGGAMGGALAARWWASGFLGVGVAAYLLHYDTPPLEEATTSWSWLVLARVTVKFR